MTNEDMNVLTVDAVAQQLGITPRTLRYYEEVGLIAPPLRTSGGHRIYDQATVDRLNQILRLKDYLGISLQDIQEIMSAEESLKDLQQTFHENGQQPDAQKVVVERYVDVLQNLIGRMNAKIENVTAMRDVYEKKLERSIRFLNDMGTK